MTRFSRFFRRMFEKWVGAFYEGPEPPDRLGDMVIVFANLHPRATRAQWAKFATEHARECYRSGWVRGMENSERDEREPEIEPEVMADAMDGGAWRERPAGPRMEAPPDDDWRWMNEPITLEGNPDAIVEDDEKTEEQIAMDQLNTLMRGDS